MIPEEGTPAARDLESALRAWGRERERSLASHPNVDQLSRYSQKRLDADEHDVIEEHLTYCSECAMLFLELPGLLGEHDATPPEPALFSSPRRFSYASWLSKPGVAPRAVVASLVLSAIAVGWALVETSRPRPDSELRFIGPSIEIFADGTRRESVPNVRIPSSGESLLLSFRLPSVEEPWPAEATAVLLGANDQILHRAPSVRLDRSTSFEIVLGARSLPPGPYQVELRSEGPSSSRALVRFRFELVRH